MCQFNPTLPLQQQLTLVAYFGRADFDFLVLVENAMSCVNAPRRATVALATPTLLACVVVLWSAGALLLCARLIALFCAVCAVDLFRQHASTYSGDPT